MGDRCVRFPRRTRASSPVRMRISRKRSTPGVALISFRYARWRLAFASAYQTNARMERSYAAADASTKASRPKRRNRETRAYHARSSALRRAFMAATRWATAPARRPARHAKRTAHANARNVKTAAMSTANAYARTRVPRYATKKAPANA